MKPTIVVAALCFFNVSTFARAADPATQPYFEQDVAASNPLRSEQAKELDAYIVAMKQDTNRLHALFKPDYSSPMAFEKSAEPYRQAFCDSIGYPPPGDVPKDAATFDKIGEDAIGTYYRAAIPILPGVHAEGVYIVPKGLTGKAPLVISMHGGGGSPDRQTNTKPAITSSRTGRSPWVARSSAGKVFVAGKGSVLI